VRIEFNPDELKEYPLNIGLSLYVKVDTKNVNGVPLLAMKEGAVRTTDIYQKQFDAAEKHIQSLLNHTQIR
jgi:membrane fusion protein (multidrug efflux system)